MKTRCWLTKSAENLFMKFEFMVKISGYSVLLWVDSLFLRQAHSELLEKEHKK